MSEPLYPDLNANQVKTSAPALLDTRNIYEWLREGSKESAADEWIRALTKAKDSLKEFPNRCPIAPESRPFLIEIRQFLFGMGKRQWRIIFGVSVDEISGEDVVRIYRIRDSRQKTLDEMEIMGKNYDE